MYHIEMICVGPDLKFILSKAKRVVGAWVGKYYYPRIEFEAVVEEKALKVERRFRHAK